MKKEVIEKLAEAARLVSDAQNLNASELDLDDDSSIAIQNQLSYLLGDLISIRKKIESK